MHGTASDYKYDFGNMGLDTRKTKLVSFTVIECLSSKLES